MLTRMKSTQAVVLKVRVSRLPAPLPPHEGLAGLQRRQAQPGLSRDCSGWTADLEKQL